LDSSVNLADTVLSALCWNLGRFVNINHFRRMHRSANGLNFGILGAVIVTGGNNVAVD
jgi:hypothetical protein